MKATNNCAECGNNFDSNLDTLVCDECFQENCSHSDTDHWECLDCGKQLDPGEAIDAAMDYFED